MAARSSATPSSFGEQVLMTGTARRTPVASRPSPSMDLSSDTVLSESGLSPLLTACTSAISRMPALIAWMSSPSPGADTTTIVCAARTTSTSSWPTPTVSMMIMSYPAASRMSTASNVPRASPPRAPRVAMLRTNTEGWLETSPMRMRSPRMEPPEKGLDGSTAMMPTLRPDFRTSATSLDTSVDLPLPDTPVTPTTWARPARR